MWAPVTKSSKIASEIIAATGLVCLRVATLPGHPGRSRVTIATVDDRNGDGARIWLASSRSAERIEAKVFLQHGTRRGGALVIEAAPDEVDGLLRASAQLLGIVILSEERVDAIVASLIARIDAAVAKVGRAATLKTMRAAIARADTAELRSAIS